jgi:hypothetical protein
MIRHDRYRPTQGHEYAKLGLVRPSGADVEFVFSRALYGEQELRMRPTAMPLEAMVVTGYPVQGFIFLLSRSPHLNSCRSFMTLAPACLYWSLGKTFST